MRSYAEPCVSLYVHLVHHQQSELSRSDLQLVVIVYHRRRENARRR